MFNAGDQHWSGPGISPSQIFILPQPIQQFFLQPPEGSCRLLRSEAKRTVSIKSWIVHCQSLTLEQINLYGHTGTGANNRSHLFLYHAEFFVHCLEMISVEPGSVKQSLEVPEGDPAHGPHDARHEGGHRARGEVHDLGGDTGWAWELKGH